MSRLAPVIGVLVASIGCSVGAGVAAADCVGPQISYDVAPVGPGQVVRVTGEYWGTDCYDTGNRPRGEGNLGKPQRDIEIVVLQDGIGPVVARGDAGSDYRFVVDVPVPGPLHAGTLIIAGRADDPGPRFAFGPEIPVAEVAPPPATEGTANEGTVVPADPVTFEAAAQTDSTIGDDGRRWLVAGAVLVVVIAGGLVWWGRRRRPFDPGAGGT